MEIRRIDVLDFLVTGLEAVVFIGTIKVLAYRYHGHPLAQAILTGI
jgi:hypothetical protein